MSYCVTKDVIITNSRVWVWLYENERSMFWGK